MKHGPTAAPPKHVFPYPPSSPWCETACIRPAMHPAWRRCSSLKYSRYSRSSRLAIRAPRSAIWSLFTVDRPLGRHGNRGANRHLTTTSASAKCTRFRHVDCAEDPTSCRAGCWTRFAPHAKRLGWIRARSSEIGSNVREKSCGGVQKSAMTTARRVTRAVRRILSRRRPRVRTARPQAGLTDCLGGLSCRQFGSHYGAM